MTPGRPSAAVLLTWHLLPLLLLVAPPARAEIDFPDLTGRVVDRADISSDATERRLAAQLEAHEAETTNQVVVVTLPSLQGYPIERFGVELGRHWQVGQAGRDNGALLIVAPNERKVRIEVGYGLEGALTDSLARVIIENEITPHFRLGNFDAGVAGGTSAILRAIKGSYEAPSKFLSKDFTVNPAVAIFLGFILLMLLFKLFMSHKHAIQSPQRRKRRQHVDDDGQVWTFGSDDDWDYGGGFDGGSDGFSGGGGSFGGGGASGSW